MLPGSEAKRLFRAADRNVCETGSLQARAKRHGIDHYHGVEEVHELKPAAPNAVGSDENASRSEHPAHFPDQTILKRGGRDVVQHCE